MVASPPRHVLTLVLLLVLMSGCSIKRESDTPVDSPSVAPSPQVTSSTAPPPKQAGVYRAGDCLAFVDDSYQLVGCETEHQAEVIMSDRPPDGFPAHFPPSDTPVSPVCRAEMITYLGSPDVVATRLEHRVLWPTEEQWNVGDRWFACAVLERDSNNKAAKRTGTLAGALSDGLRDLQKCYVEEPLDEPPRVIPCAQPHRSEATPGVIVLGSYTDPAPSYETMVDRSLPQCTQTVNDYLGGSGPGVKPIVVVPGVEYWPSGATTAVCYAVSEKPVTGTMRER